MKRCLLMLGVLAVTLPLGASASTPLEGLAEKANAFRLHGENQQALEVLKEIYKLRPSAQVVAQMGLIEADLERWADAEGHLSEALKSPEPWVQRYRKQLEDALKRVEGNFGQLMLRGTPGVEVLLEGRSVGTLPLPKPLHLEAGLRKLEVRGEGFLPERRSLIIRAGETVDDKVILVPLPKVTPVVSDMTVEKTKGEQRLRESAEVEKARRKTLTMQVGGAVLLLGAAAAIGWGIGNIVTDGECRAKGPRYLCDAGAKEKTARKGLLFLGAGVATAGAAGVLLYQSARTTVTASPWGVAGRF